MKERVILLVLMLVSGLAVPGYIGISNDNQSLESQISELEQNENAQQALIENLQSTETDLQGQLVDATANGSSLESDIDALTTTRDEIMQQKQGLEERLNSSQSNNSAMQAQLDLLNASLEQINLQIESYSQDLENANDTIESLTLDLAIVQIALNALQGVHLLTEYNRDTACLSGGIELEQGLDDGDDNSTANDGVLQEGEIDEITTICAPSPWADIQSGSIGSSPTRIASVGSDVYFAADDGVNGIELWRSNGTAEGTYLVKDIATGSGSSTPFNLVAVGKTVFFRAADKSGDLELWKSDGTESGTSRVKDINPTGSSAIPPNLLIADFYQSASMAGILYFAADDGSTGLELWRSDGTDSGTWMVKDIKSGSGDGMISISQHNMIRVGSKLFFNADDGVNGMELWRTDGTTAGTAIVVDINLGSGSGVDWLVGVADTNQLFFRANDGTNGKELWKSDGSVGGTVMVKDINSGSGGSNPSRMTMIDGVLYFRAYDGQSGSDLWVSDGTDAGTQAIQASSGPDPTSTHSFTEFGDWIYFTADDGINGDELWRTDGTQAGTSMFVDIATTTYCNAFQDHGSNPGYLRVVDGILFFTADDCQSGRELWMTNGTVEGTVLVHEIGAGDGDADIRGMVISGDLLFFSAGDATFGAELWTSDSVRAHLI